MTKKKIDPKIAKMLQENARRERRFDKPYNPLTGEGCCGKRVEVATPIDDIPTAMVPVAMLTDPAYRSGMGATEWQRLRCHHDFEFWAARCAHITNKREGGSTPFVLNEPQRSVVRILEADRLAKRPLRLIVLKARQWGCSTLTLMYMAWMQICVCRNRNSLICCHVKDSAANIRGMYTLLLSRYPRELWEGDAEPALKAFERAINVREIAGHECRVTVASCENPEAIRGQDIFMAHLSEVAFWRATPQHSAGNLIRAICGSIALAPNSLVVMESTANGVGNYFHKEWLRCSSGHGDKRTIFVAWHDIESYRMTPESPAEVAATLTEYEQKLWDMGLSLSQINWYRNKRREYQTDEQMQSEYPTTDAEAFINSGSGVFAMEAIERLRSDGCSLEGVQGAFTKTPRGLPAFTPDSRGESVMWCDVMRDERYVVMVDVGGRSQSSDWSVVAVLSIPSERIDKPEVVAQWRGHCDHDILVDRAMLIARYYNNALLVVESNSLESDTGRGDDSLYLLYRLGRDYTNTYLRTCPDTIDGYSTRRVGFHTNRSTKALVIDKLIQAVRDQLYVEHDPAACDELSTYEQLPNGSYAAKEGCHDDLLMTRAIALHIIDEQPPAVPHGIAPDRVWPW